MDQNRNSPAIITDKNSPVIITGPEQKQPNTNHIPEQKQPCHNHRPEQKQHCHNHRPATRLTIIYKNINTRSLLRTNGIASPDWGFWWERATSQIKEQHPCHKQEPSPLNCWYDDNNVVAGHSRLGLYEDLEIRETLSPVKGHSCQ